AESHDRIGRLDHDSPRGRNELPSDQAEEGRLAGAVLADEAMPTRAEVERDVTDDDHGGCVRVGDGIEMQCGHGGTPGSEIDGRMSRCGAQCLPRVAESPR